MVSPVVVMGDRGSIMGSTPFIISSFATYNGQEKTPDGLAHYDDWNEYLSVAPPFRSTCVACCSVWRNYFVSLWCHDGSERVGMQGDRYVFDSYAGRGGRADL